MAAPFIQAILAMGQYAGVLALKARVASQMVSLKAYLIAHIGATAGGIAAGALAGAVAAAWWVHLNGGSEEEMKDAAAKRVGRDTAEGIISWMKNHLL